MKLWCVSVTTLTQWTALCKIPCKVECTLEQNLFCSLEFFRETLPIIGGGSSARVVYTCVKTSLLYCQFQNLRLFEIIGHALLQSHLNQMSVVPVKPSSTASRPVSCLVTGLQEAQFFRQRMHNNRKLTRMWELIFRAKWERTQACIL